MKFNLGQILSVAGIVQQLVKKAKEAPGSGAEKHAAVAAAVIDAVPVIEGALGKDLVNDLTFADAIDAVIVAEAAVLKAQAAVVDARSKLAAVMTDIKSR